MNRVVIRTMLAVAVVVIAGCSSSSKSSSSVSSPATTASGSSGATTTVAAASITVGLATDPTLGRILVDSQGLTLYRNTKEKGTTIVCTGGCATTWPPVTVPAGTTPTGSPGLPGTLGTVTRPDGTVQVTYRNWPLYRYSKDSKAGDTSGQGVGGVWYAVTATGSANGSANGSGSAGSTATTAPAAPAATTTTVYSGY